MKKRKVVTKKAAKAQSKKRGFVPNPFGPPTGRTPK
jgi:hypothetical protein